MPPESGRETLEGILKDAPAIETEVFAHGRLPLAWSARCFTARRFNLQKDTCEFKCIDFPDGLKFLPDQRLFVFRNGKTFHAISAVCTHLGCTVRAEALSRPEDATVEGQPLRLTHRFMCPCHGSQYDPTGKVIRGPAPLSLALAHVDDVEGNVVLSPWTETDFRTNTAPWWKS